MTVPFQHIEGTDNGKVRLYALSTCMWCRKTRELMEQIGVAYDLIYVDLLNGAEKEEVMQELDRWNPQHTFPTLVLGDDRIIIGYEKNDIGEALGG